jgi:hypothetical protein
MWSSGQWEQAIKAYFKLDKFVSRAMAEGSEFHEGWDKHITETKTLPAVFGGTPLINPRCEEKMVIPVYDWLDLVIKPDCIDAPILHEFKTGVMTSSDYVNTYQPAIYAVGLTMQDILIDRIHIHLYNQYAKKSDFSMVWVTPKLLADGLNYIETVGAEMHNYFLDNNLYEKFGAKK